MPRIVFSVVDLPGRVAAEQADELALAHLERRRPGGCGSRRSTCRRLGSRSSGSCRRSAACSPRYASITRSLVATSSNEPSAILIAVVERDDAVGDALDDVHVVLDHENRVAAVVAQPADQLGDLVRLGRVHPGRRLVEQQEPRVRSPSRARSRAAAGSRRRGCRRAGPCGSRRAAGRRRRASPRRARAISRSSRRARGSRSIDSIDASTCVCP